MSRIHPPKSKQKKERKNHHWFFLIPRTLTLTNPSTHTKMRNRVRTYLVADPGRRWHDCQSSARCCAQALRAPSRGWSMVACSPSSGSACTGKGPRGRHQEFVVSSLAHRSSGRRRGGRGSARDREEEDAVWKTRTLSKKVHLWIKASVKTVIPQI